MVLAIHSNAFQWVSMNSPVATTWTLNKTQATHSIHFVPYFSELYAVGSYYSCFMAKETEAKAGNREHVYFKVLLKNIIHTIKFLLKKYINIHIYLFKYRQLFMSYSQSIHLDQYFLRYI